MKIRFLILGISILFVEKSYAQHNVEHRQSTDSVTTATQEPSADWTFFVFVQSRCDLHSFSINNIQDMASVGSNGRINIVLQWEELYKKGTWRYKVEKNNVQLIESNPNETTIDPVKALVDGARWAFKTYPAKHTALVFWGHGSGVLDPAAWWNHMLRNYPCRDSEGAVEELLDVLKGILFNFEHKVYMTNQHLALALDQITRDVLGGKKIDVIGMDSCLMAMYEIVYEIRKHAHYFVGSQQVEHAFGWPYGNILSAIGATYSTPLQCVQKVVHHFGEFYRHKVPWYTQSAIDLSQIDVLRDTLDRVVQCINACKKDDLNATKRLVALARQNSLQLNVPSYIDLYSFLYELNTNLDILSKKSFAVSAGDIQLKTLMNEDEEYEPVRRPTASAIAASPMLPVVNAVVGTPEYDHLKTALKDAMSVIQSLVVANVAGPTVNHAKGISIYFPKNPHYIDHSYPKTQFAQSSSWLSFLHTIE